MKKLAKLFLFVLVFALMASVLVACGEDKTTTDEPSTPTDTSETPTEQTGKEEQSEPTKPSTPGTPDTPSEPEGPTVTPDEPTHIHAFGEWKVITNPTCTTKGLKKRTCKCGEEETEEIEALGHDIIHHEGKEPTCTEEGYKAYDTCSRCDYTTYETLPIMHRFSDWQVSASPTCTSGGIETRACSVCGTIERRSVNALGHNYGEWKTTKEPTCTETGEKESICSRCNDVQKQTLSALGHSFGDWVVTKEATCQKGSKERACSVCGYVEKKDIPADYTTHIFEGDFCTVCGEHKGTEGLQFELVTNDTVAVTGYTGSSTTVYIPSSYVGATVTSIKAEAFKDDTTITEIVIPDSVTSIGNSAFYGCSSLTSITIPDSVTSIGNDAFSGCSSLTSITIPDSVTSIGNGVLYNCPIETATIPTLAISRIPKSNLKTVVITSGKSIGYRAFYECRSLTSITLGNSVTSIGEWAFYECSSLTSITLGNSVTSIGDSSFSWCSSLTSVYYTGDIASWCGITFGDNPLYRAHNLYIDNELIKDIVIPDTVTEIKAGAFIGWNGTSITIPDSVTSIGTNAFYNCPIETATIPAIACSYVKNSHLKTVVITSGESIGNSAFSGCSSLTSITIPDSVTSIGNSAFDGCSKLTSVTIGNSVTSIGGGAFYNCSNLTIVYYTGDIASWCGITFGDDCSNPLYYAHNLYINNKLIKDIVIPDTVTEIKARAFNGWNGTSITLGNSVTSIGDDAFNNCSSLTSVYYTGEIASWCGITFSGHSSNPLYYARNLYIDNELIKEIVIPDTVTEIKAYAFWSWNGTSITILNSVTSIGNSAFYTCRSLTSVTLGNSVTSIGNSAFTGCSKLTSITIPDSITSIGNSAFYYCSSLTSITIPDSVTSIGERAFSDCRSLTSITIPDSVTSIEYSAFYNCPIETATIPTLAISRIPKNNLKTVVITSGESIGESAFRGCSSLTSVTIPDSVTSIGDSAFYGCSKLTSITIPASVTSIGEEAFRNCSSLTSITFQGTKAQWNAISKGYNWDYYTGNYTVHCTDDI